MLGSTVGTLILVLLASTVQAVTIAPNSFADGADVLPGDGVCDSDSAPGVIVCTLRAAVMEANELAGLDDIDLSSGEYNLTLVGSGEEAGDLDVSDPLRIVGVPGSVIDGGGTDRIFQANGAALEIEGVTVRNGSSTSGGCLMSNDTLTLSHVEITDCECSGYGGGVAGIAIGTEIRIKDSWIHGNSANSGGGIHVSNQVSLVLENSTLSSNQATNTGGGGIFSTGNLFINNSTIVLNAAEGDGGGILAFAGRLYLASSTVVGNMCDLDADEDGTGCGIWTPTDKSFVRNSIIADNLNWNSGVPVTEADDCDGDFYSYGYNLIGYLGGLCSGFSAANDDLLGSPVLDPELGYLGDHGGWNPTILPDPGSPAVDGGNPSGCLGHLSGQWMDPPTLLEQEQRGYPRALDDDFDGVARCDIGAVESALFADGFESADANTWSSSSP